MKDRFSDTSKQIYDNPDFDEIQNAIGQLEEIIGKGSSSGRGRQLQRRASQPLEDGTGARSSSDPSHDERRGQLSISDSKTIARANGKGIGKSSSTTAIASATVADRTSHTDEDGIGGGPKGAKKPVNVNINNNNTIIIPRPSTTKSNGSAIPTRSDTITTTIAINKNDWINNKPLVIVATTSTGSGGIGNGNHHHVKSTSSPIINSATYRKKSSSASTSVTTTAILHSSGPESRRHSGGDINDDGRSGQGKVMRSYANGVNGILRKSSIPISSARHHHPLHQPQASQRKGTATVSTETTRSGSKTPEITITPGSEVLGGDLVETELPESRLLLSSAGSGSSRVVVVVEEGERISPEDLPDSGCTGLLDEEEDEDSCSVGRAGSSSGEKGLRRGSSSSATVIHSGKSGGGGVSGISDHCAGGGDRDSGGGSVASSSGIGGYQRSTAATTPVGGESTAEVIYAEVQRRKSVNELPVVPVYPNQQQQNQHQHHLQQVKKFQPLIHVDGPLDGSPYAIVNPLVKHKALADSGISVDQMKDLDRLLSALVQEAESIDIPYHARTDSLPFSYTVPPGPTPSSAPPAPVSKRGPYGGGGSGSSGLGTSSRYSSGGGGGGGGAGSSSSSYYHQQTQYGSSSSAQPGDRYRGIEHSFSTPAGGSRHHSSSGGQSSSSYHQRQQVPQYYHHPHQQSVEDQIVNPDYSRTVTRHQSMSSGSGNMATGSRVGARNSDQSHQGYRVRPSLSSTSFSTGHGNGNGNGGGAHAGVAPTVRRLRSQSADGRRDSERERDEDADEWLARQMKRLQEKRASKNAPRNDWLAELKRALPAATVGGSQTGATPSAIASAVACPPAPQDRSYEHQRMTAASISEYRSYTREEVATTASSAGSMMGGGANSGMTGGPRRSHVSYSSEDDDDVELEMFQRGRRVQRHFSESAYDRGMTSASSTRAPSQLSNIVETPFPTCPPTPYFNRPVSPGKPPRSPKGIRRQISSSSVPVLQEIPSRMDRVQTPLNPRPIYMVDSEVKFAQDLSEHWYKPFSTREETVAALVNQQSGAFLIRNSNSFPGAFGLAVKVSDTATEKGIRHFLIEPTRFGVRLRGSPLEPVFSSLSALVYAHSIDPLALPTTLALPSFDILPKSSQSTTALLLRQGAACQLLFLGMTSVECLTGDEAIHRGITQITGKSPIPIISLRLSKHGLTLTDVFRKQFFRLHFALNDISYTSLVPGRSVAYGNEVKQVFAVVARAPRAQENSVIVLAELEQGQPANAIVSFILRVIAWQH